MARRILFITTDQQRFDALGCNGGTVARTPVVDSFAKEGIRVNAVSPGLTLSETQIATTSNAYAGAALDTKALKRPQVPDDLVGAVMFLLSDASNFMTGQTMNVDGGQMMH